MTQVQLGAAVGVRFQQIQKYETGTNRVSASRLWKIAGTLGVPVTYFFEGLSRSAPSDAETLLHSATTPESRALLRVYYSFPPKQRHCLLQLVKAMGDAT